MRLFTLEPSGYLGRALAARLAEHGHTIVGPPKDASLADIQAACVSADAAVLDLLSPGREAEITALLAHIGSHNFEAAGRTGFTVVGVSTVLTWNQSNKSSKKSSKESNWKLRKCSPRFKGVRLLETSVLSTAREGAAPVTALVVAAGVLYGAGEHDFHHLFKAAWMHAGEGAAFAGLPLIGDGKNVIPTIHVYDLVNSLRLLLESPPAEQSYFVAVDQGHTTQKALVTAIATGLGDGKIKNVERMDEKVLLAASNAAAGEYADEVPAAAASAVAAAGGAAAPSAAPAATAAASSAALSSAIASANLLTNGNPELILADMKIEAEWLLQQPFEWVCEQGPAASPEVFEQLRQEFVKARNLRPVRVWITGAPGAGKSHYAAALAQQLYVPHIRLEELIAAALAAKDEFAERIQTALAESANAKNGGGKDGKGGKKSAAAKAKEKAAQLLALQSAGGQAQSAAGGAGKAGSVKRGSASVSGGKGGAAGAPSSGVPPDLALFDTDVPRLPAYLLVKIVKAAVRAPLARNKGFILDNFPRTAEESRWFFSPDVEEDPETGAPIAQIEDKRAIALAAAAQAELDGEEAPQSAEPAEPQARDPTTMVDSIVLLGCSESLAAARMKNLPAQLVRPNHNDEEGFARRWARWLAISEANGSGLEGNAAAAALGPAAILSPLAFVQADVEVLELPEGVAADTSRGLELLRSYVSRRGRADNFHPTEEEQRAAADAQQREARKLAAEQEADAKAKAAEEQQLRVRHATNDSLRRAAVLLEDSLLVEASALPLRNYLLQNVIPALVDGLLDVCKTQPEDPVDALAEYLFNYSVDVPADKENAQERPAL